MTLLLYRFDADERPTPVKVTEGPKTDALIDQYRSQGLDVVIVPTSDESKFAETRAK